MVLSSKDSRLTVVHKRSPERFDFLTEPGKLQVSPNACLRIEPGRAPPDTANRYVIPARSNGQMMRWILSNGLHLPPYPETTDYRNPELFRRVEIQFTGLNLKGGIAAITESISSAELMGEISSFKAHALEIRQPGYWGASVETYFPAGVADHIIADVMLRNMPIEVWDSTICINGKTTRQQFDGTLAIPELPFNRQLVLLRFLTANARKILWHIANYLATRDCFIHSSGAGTVSGTALGAILFYLPDGVTFDSFQRMVRADRTLDFYQPMLEKVGHLPLEGFCIELTILTTQPVKATCSIERIARGNYSAIVPPRTTVVGQTSNGSKVYRMNCNLVSENHDELNLAIKKIAHFIKGERAIKLHQVGSPFTTMGSGLEKLVFDPLAKKTITPLTTRELLLSCA